ncbi:MAG TPA: hypothetical protein VG821_11375 [Rhizomicrobium sp.]|nr:hypothetical protein [Rhizomicrobium sp.]
MSAYPHSLSPMRPRYACAMTTPILIAAAARKPRRNPRAIPMAGGRGEAKKPSDNYRAQPAKKTPGAPLGNRNAARGGAQRRERHSRLDALVRQLCACADAAIAACAQGEQERRILAALLERRP